MESQVAAILFRRNGIITIALSDTEALEIMGYTANQWYQIELRNIDWSNRTYDFYVNQIEESTRVPFRGDQTTGLTRIDLYNFTAQSEGWIDEIRME